MPYRFIALAIIALVSTGCAGAQPRGIASSEDGASHAAGSSTDGSESDIRAIRSELSSLAEMERRGRYEPGLGIHESGLRERAGDSSGAVFAAYKDLSYAYANGAVSEQDIDARLDRLDERAMSDGARDADVLSAVAAIRLFRSGKWAEAASALIVLAAGDGQADSFEIGRASCRERV